MDNLKYLQEYLSIAPIPLGLIRAIDCKYISQVSIKGDILDAGCGDGLFLKILLNSQEYGNFTGVDFNETELKKAEKINIYNKLLKADLALLPFENNKFDCIISNSVLEHVADLDSALSELARVLKVNGLFVFTVPSEYLSENFFFSAVLKKIGLKKLAIKYAGFKHKIWNHRHVYSIDNWKQKLKSIGFEITEAKYIHSKKVTELCDIFTFSGAISIVNRKILGRLLLFPSTVRGKLMARLLKRIYLNEEDVKNGSTLFFVLKKVYNE